MSKEIKQESSESLHGPSNQDLQKLSSIIYLTQDNTPPKISLDIGTLLKLIPSFDTTQTNQVYRFIRSCDSAFNLASESQKSTLLVYVLNNIIGISASDVHSREFQSWDILKSFLIDRFSNVKTISHLNLELQSMFQKPGENITDYFHRVDLCRSKIIEKLTVEIFDDTLAGRKSTTEETALNVFVNGLSSDIGSMLRTKEFRTLSEAARFAMQEDKVRAMNYARQTLFKSVNSTPTSRQIMNRPINQRNYNNNLIRPNFVNPANTQNNNNPIRPNFANPASTQNFAKICNYCKNPGHLITECRKRAYNNNLRASNGQPSMPTQRALPAPPAQINNLNSQAAIEETSDSMGTASNCSQLIPNFHNTLQLE